MKTVAAILTICLMLLLGFMGCSKEEPPAPPPKRPPKIKIVKPPKQQEPEKQKDQIPAEQEKEEIPAKEAQEGRVAVVGEIPKQEAEKLKPGIAGGIPKKETKEVKPAGVEEKPAQRPEKAAEEEGAVAKEAEEGKTALVKEIPEKQAEAVKRAGAEEKSAQKPKTVIEEEEKEEEEMGSYYIVKKGESLYDVASREDVYGNKLKWPILYRMNIDTLGDLKTEGDVVERALPEGLKLRILNPDEVEENLEKRPSAKWVVNVLSTTTNEKVVPITMTLIKNGHSAYITRTTIKGKVWTRLRVGFFTSKAEADAQRKRIRDLLHISDPWSVKLGPMEFAEFAGY
jgi:LysM repeat protein